MVRRLCTASVLGIQAGLTPAGLYQMMAWRTFADAHLLMNTVSNCVRFTRGFGTRAGQPGDEVQRLEDDLGGAIADGFVCLKYIGSCRVRRGLCHGAATALQPCRLIQDSRPWRGITSRM